MGRKTVNSVNPEIEKIQNDYVSTEIFQINQEIVTTCLCPFGFATNNPL